MNDKLPYEESLDQQLNDLPLPDEEQSWQKMKLLLEDDDDDDRIIPPVFLKGCMGWSLLLIAVLVGLWLLIRPEKWWTPKDMGKIENQKSDSSKLVEAKKMKQSKITSREKDTIFIHDTKIKIDSVKGVRITDTVSNHTKAVGRLPAAQAKEIYHRASKNSKTAGHPLIKQSRTSERTSRDPKVVKVKKNPVSEVAIKKDETTIVEKAATPNTDSSAMHNNQPPVQPVVQQVDSVKKDTVAIEIPNEKQQKTKTPNKLYVSAGLGLQQQIPLAGQKATPYNYYGRRGSLADYIPSVYLRLHRENKWFIQGEFRYGAPESVKDLVYEGFSFTDTSGTRSTTVTLRLKKTFYHQLALSFNYQILPNWTAGTGTMYSSFYRAIAEREIIQRVNQNVTSSKQIEQIQRGDSLGYSAGHFKNSRMDLLVQTEYQWKKFSFNLRYTKGLQPFIRYTDPNGALREEKNHSLQFMVRYRLWESKRF